MMDTYVPKLTEVCFRILLCLIGVLGNCTLLFYSMPTTNCRIEPYKILLINLALSDLLTNLMVDIPGILVEMYGTWFMGDSYCKIFWFTASLSITSSILTTLAMSIFWFQKLVGSRPANCKIHRAAELRMLSIFVTVTWLVSIVFSIPLLYVCSVYMLKNDSGEEHDQQPAQKVFGCRDAFPSKFYKHLYEIMYLVLANALPIMVMFFINVRVIIFLVRNRKRIAVLKCTKAKLSSALNSSVPGCGDHLNTKCQDSKGHKGQMPGSSGQVKDMLFHQAVSCVSSTTTEVEFVTVEKTNSNSQGAVKMIINNLGRRELIRKYFNSLEENKRNREEHRHTSASIIYDPCMFNYKEKAQRTVLCNLQASHLVLIPETDGISVDRNTDQSETYDSVEEYPTVFTCSQEQCILGNAKLPAVLQCTDNQNTKSQLVAKTARKPSATTQIRATISIMAVVGVFFIFWVTHLTLRIKENTRSSEHIIETASLIAASYTTIIPYVFIYSMKKCPCRF